MGTMPQVYPHVILDNFTTKLSERTANILKHLFPVPKPDHSDYISFRHHTYGKHGGPKSIVLEEIGPRFEMRLFKAFAVVGLPIEVSCLEHFSISSLWPNLFS
ncbi:unnamed protein product [Prunus armeniaca]|uniref:Brix domain-containing protein n=1 Tax=Prunus armeniaca TaxID=36596 RepID=A0A6J5Y3B8_PRUAR|nr:unnamed protein product [Prunus armeniaca]